MDAEVLARRVEATRSEAHRSAAGDLLEHGEPQAAALFALQDAVAEGRLLSELREEAESLLASGGFGNCSFAAQEVLASH